MLLNVLNVNVIYYVHSNVDILECIHNNPMLLKMFIAQYEFFMNVFNNEIELLKNKLENINLSTLNPNAKEYQPIVIEDPEIDLFNPNIENYLPFDLLNL